MGRCREPSSASFDLLLDTMCNMFGGMVLIAILLALLSQTSGHVSSEGPVEDDSSFIDAESASLQAAELVQLPELIAQRERTLAHMTNATIAVDQKDMELIRQTVSRLESKRKSLDKTLTEQKVESESQETTLSQLEEDIRVVDAQCKRESAKVENRKLRLPRLQATKKSPVFLAVKGGVLCAINDVRTVRPPFSKRTYDLTSVTVDHEPGRLDVIEIRRTSGGRATRDGMPGSTGSLILRNVDKHTEFLSFAVYPDSYREFNYVKEFFTSRGYDFNWTRMEDEQTISIIPAESIETQ